MRREGAKDMELSRTEATLIARQRKNQRLAYLLFEHSASRVSWPRWVLGERPIACGVVAKPNGYARGLVASAARWAMEMVRPLRKARRTFSARGDADLFGGGCCCVSTPAGNQRV